MAAAHIILASASPRRVELLRAFNLNFDVEPSRAEELHDETLTAAELCATNALRKAEQVAREHENVVVLGADTLVTLDGALFGKPRDLDHAFQMLARLSGQTHQVVTGVALLHLRANRQEVFTVETRVTFKPLTPDTINTYIQTVPVLDKAGAYAIQERGQLLIEKIEGSLSNVIGLPLERLAESFCQWQLITPRERDKIAANQRPQDLQT